MRALQRTVHGEFQVVISFAERGAHDFREWSGKKPHKHIILGFAMLDGREFKYLKTAIDNNLVLRLVLFVGETSSTPKLRPPFVSFDIKI